MRLTPEESKQKEKDLQFLKDFAKISISSICRDLDVSNINLMNGRSGAKTTKRVKEELVKELNKLLTTQK